jgi:hypothetical protein
MATFVSIIWRGSPPLLALISAIDTPLTHKPAPFLAPAKMPSYLLLISAPEPAATRSTNALVSDSIPFASIYQYGSTSPSSFSLSLQIARFSLDIGHSRREYIYKERFFSGDPEPPLPEINLDREAILPVMPSIFGFEMGI